MGSNLPPITRGANSQVPDYMANADTLFQALVKNNQRMAHITSVIREYRTTAEVKKAVVGFDERDLNSMGLLLKDGPNLDDQIRKMRDDFYSGDPARKKPWLDMVYDEFDQGLLVRYDPANPRKH